MDQRTLDRFLAKIDKNGPIPTHRPELGPCHLWTAHRQPNGYGQFYFGEKLEYAHRVAFLLATGRWPETCALHHCDNRACVRGSHLFEGTHAVNMADCVAKGRQARGTTLGLRHGEHNACAKLTDEKVRMLRKLCASGVPQREVARIIGTSQANVSDIALRKHWSHVA